MMASERTFNRLMSMPETEEINRVENTSIALKKILINAERINCVILNRFF